MTFFALLSEGNCLVFRTDSLLLWVIFNDTKKIFDLLGFTMSKQFSWKSMFKNMKFATSWKSLVISVVMDTQYRFAFLAAVGLQMFCTSVQSSVVPPAIFFCCSFHFMLCFHLIIGAGFCLIVFFLSLNESGAPSHTPSILVTPFYFFSIMLTHLAFVRLSFLSLQLGIEMAQQVWAGQEFSWT